MDLTPALKGPHHGAGVLAKLMLLPVIGLSRCLKLCCKIGVILGQQGPDVAALVAIYRPFAEAIPSQYGL